MDAVHVRLVRIDEPLFTAAMTGRLEEHVGGKLGPVAGHVHSTLEQGRAFLARCPDGAAWLAVDEGTGEIVGTCAFKDGVNAAGEVEIAYFTFPPYEGRGYAKAMARRMAEVAAGLAGLRRVIAHTLPEKNASGSVLTGAGFTFDGEVIDPEDGRVWRWVRERELINGEPPLSRGG